MKRILVDGCVMCPYRRSILRQGERVLFCEERYRLVGITKEINRDYIVDWCELDEVEK